MKFEDRLARKLRVIHTLRESLQDHKSPVEDIWRPYGMRRTHYRTKLRLLEQKERELALMLESHWGKFIEKQKEKENGT